MMRPSRIAPIAWVIGIEAFRASAGYAQSYTGDIKPILDASCNSCHNTTAPTLLTYSDAQTNIDGIIRSLSPSALKPMPQGGASLDAATIQKFSDWKAAGTPQTGSGKAAGGAGRNPGRNTATNTATGTGTGVGTPPGTTTPPGAGGGNPTPLVLDLTGEGVRFAGRTVAFDIQASGATRLVSWPEPNVGFLFLDRLGTGCVGSGAQLFGDATVLDGTVQAKATDGFAAIGQYDANGDGVIDAADPVFAQLLVWVDRNGDGRCTSDEVAPLAAYHVTALHLAYRRSFVQQNGERYLPRFTGLYSFRTGDGQLATRTLADVFLTITEK